MQIQVERYTVNIQTEPFPKVVSVFDGEHEIQGRERHCIEDHPKTFEALDQIYEIEHRD